MRARLFLAACVVCLACAIAVRATPAVSIRLTFPSAPAISLGVVADAVDETARIWSSYGVMVSVARPEPNVDREIPISVVLDLHREVEAGDACLGDIRFGADGLPEAAVTLYYRALARFASEAAGTWPEKMQQQMLSRAIGRALAHEIGHFILRSPHHEERGLMRSRLRASALTDPSRRTFFLNDLEQDRLRIVLAALSTSAEHGRQ